MLKLYLSPELSRDHGDNLLDPAEVEIENWLDHWYLAYVAKSSEDAGVYAFMNKETGYVFLQPCAAQETFDDAVKRFVFRLQRFSGYNLQQRYERFCTIEGNTPVGSFPMNNMQYHVLATANCDYERIEYAWNSRIHGNKRPIDTFMELLQDHVDIPFKETSVPYLKVVK